VSISGRLRMAEDLWNHGVRLVAVLLLVTLVTACASRPPADDPEAVAEYEQLNDPAEPTNRAVFGFNQALDKAIIKPLAQGYRWLLPNPVRKGVHNFLSNLREPLTFLNDVLQGEVSRAGVTLGRFGINSTVGLLGLIDVAAEIGLPPHKEDFGQTLAVWGVGEGPYVMLPILGPSNPRDLIGRVVDYFLDPFNMWAEASNQDWAVPARTVLTAIDQRERLLDPLDDLEKSSLDFYVSIRSMSRQMRASEVRNADLPDDQLPNLGQNKDDFQIKTPEEASTSGTGYDFEFDPNAEETSASPAAN